MTAIGQTQLARFTTRAGTGGRGQKCERSILTDEIARDGTTACVGCVSKATIARDRYPARGGLVISYRPIVEIDLAVLQFIRGHGSSVRSPSEGIGDNEMRRLDRVKGKTKRLVAGRGSECRLTEATICTDVIAIDQIGSLLGDNQCITSGVSPYLSARSMPAWPGQNHNIVYHEEHVSLLPG